MHIKPKPPNSKTLRIWNFGRRFKTQKTIRGYQFGYGIFPVIGEYLYIQQILMIEMWDLKSPQLNRLKTREKYPAMGRFGIGCCF